MTRNSRPLVSGTERLVIAQLSMLHSQRLSRAHAPPQAVPPARAGTKIKSVKISPRSGTGATQSYWRHEVVLAAEGDWLLSSSLSSLTSIFTPPLTSGPRESDWRLHGARSRIRTLRDDGIGVRDDIMGALRDDRIATLRDDKEWQLMSNWQMESLKRQPCLYRLLYAFLC
jgi:hypothetical protein